MPPGDADAADITADLVEDAESYDLPSDDIADATDILCPDGIIAVDFPCDKEFECVSDTEYKKYRTVPCGEIFDPNCCIGAGCELLGTFKCAEDEVCVKKGEFENDECVKKTGCKTGKEGELLFTFQADGEIASTPAIGEDGTIYFGTMNATFYAVDCNGNKKCDGTCRADPCV